MKQEKKKTDMMLLKIANEELPAGLGAGLGCVEERGRGSGGTAGGQRWLCQSSRAVA